MYPLCARLDLDSLRVPPSQGPVLYVDRRGREWQVYDRIRVVLASDRAEFRCVVPGRDDARARIFVGPDRVAYELRVDDSAWGRADLTDLRPETLARQLRAACAIGARYLPTCRPA